MTSKIKFLRSKNADKDEGKLRRRQTSSSELRKRFLSFFEEKGHKIVPSSSLIPSDPSVLFTTAGMQQFKPYYLGEKSPYGNKVASCQKCFRTSDIEEIGDESHVTFLEMLGNFSFGGYFKEEAIKLAYQFLIENCKLKIENFIVTVFGGDNEVPRDEESVRIWDKFGFSREKRNLRFCGREDNFWGPTGLEGPCGPTTEIHIRGVEVWNLVFNEYYQDKKRSLAPLRQKGVDTGMGLERLAMAVQNKPSVFETDLFLPMLKEIEKYAKPYNSSNPKPYRIIADHVRGAVFLISEGVFPSNIERGYVLRKVLRRAIRYRKLLGLAKQSLITLARKVIEIYKDDYPEVKSKETDILTVIQNEEEKFEKTLEEGEKIVDRFIKYELGKIGGKEAFDLYQNYGFPIEITIEDLKNRGVNFDEEELKKAFEEELKKHQELSRTASAGMFKGGLADRGEIATKYHTATHLLLAALRQILGPEIYQRGSNITAERLRFDFNYPQKLTDEQIKQVEDLVNQKIQEDIKVEMIEIPKDEAIKIAKISFDQDKYGKIVKVYKIGDFSIELCAGPHAKRTSELGRFRIVKEESSSAGIRRIRAILE